MAVLLLIALAGVLISAREYVPPPAPTRAPTVQGGLSPCLHFSLSLPVLSWILLPLQVTPAPNSPQWPLYRAARALPALLAHLFTHPPLPTCSSHTGPLSGPLGHHI